jgi:glucokinase
MILAGDIGGTNTRLALYDRVDGRFVSVVEQVFPSRAYSSFYTIARAFVAAHQVAIDLAGFGIAGPVIGGRTEVTNLPWVVDTVELAAALGIESVVLVNDLEAIAYGIAALESTDFLVLNPGVATAIGNAAVIAAGTGLGEAGLYWDGTVHWPFACEGGHVDFAPRNALEMELLVYLLERFERVSYERVLSGPGLVNIYQFLRDTGGGEEPPWLATALAGGDPAAVIAATAAAGSHPSCAQALELFVVLYGAAAGNLALQIMATGGVYVAGGIAPKILSSLARPAFIEAFLAKGRLRGLLETIPVRVVLTDRTGLLGAARCAGLRVRGGPPDPVSQVIPRPVVL